MSTTAAVPQTTTWNLDPVHSVAEFKVKHMMISHVKGQFTGISGKYVKIADTVRSFKGIIEGKYDDLPEQAFYMQGAIEDVQKKAEELKATT